MSCCDESKLYQSPLALHRGPHVYAAYSPLTTFQERDDELSTNEVTYSWNPATRKHDTTSRLTFTQNELNLELKEFHFHVPAEHTIDGKTFPAELHLVFMDPESKQISVIAMLCRLQPETKQERGGEGGGGERGGGSSVIQRVLAGEKLRIPRFRRFWNYPGSLTTPPFGVAINWLVRRSTLRLRPDDLEQLRDRSLPARPLQPRAGRIIVFVSPSEESGGPSNKTATTTTSQKEEEGKAISTQEEKEEK